MPGGRTGRGSARSVGLPGGHTWIEGQRLTLVWGKYLTVHARGGWPARLALRACAVDFGFPDFAIDFVFHNRFQPFSLLHWERRDRCYRHEGILCLSEIRHHHVFRS